MNYWLINCHIKRSIAEKLIEYVALKHAVKWYKRCGINVECVQTDNGLEFTTRFIQGLKDKPTLFQTTAERLGIRPKL